MTKEYNKQSVGLLPLDAYSYNYGGALQLLALQDAIIGNGYECRILAYLSAAEKKTFSIKRGLRYITADKIKMHIRHFLKKRRLTPEAKRCVGAGKAAFDRFREAHMRLTEPISAAQLRGARLPYDVLVCGSDQIWNPDYNIPAFFLDFAKPDQKRVIYAASVGKERLTRLQRKTYQKLMRGLDFVSVREHSARQLLQPVCEQPVQVVLDPTLLHDRAYWQTFAEGSAKHYENYIFCYFLGLTEEKIEAAKAYAAKTGKALVSIPYLHGVEEPLCRELGGIQDADVGPGDFLKLIAEADAVLTDSFHASVFSLLFEKDFWVFGRNVGSYNMNTRLDTLLGYFAAQDRMIRPEQLAKKEPGAFIPDYHELERMRQLSWDFLREALS